MIFELIILLLAIPAGYLIAWLARDELISGRIWFIALIIVSIFIGMLFYFIGIKYISWTAGFVLIVSFTSLIKSYDKKWARKI